MPRSQSRFAVLAVEVTRSFMDEGTGVPDPVVNVTRVTVADPDAWML